MFRVYDAPNHALSCADIGSFVLAVVELRCLDVGYSVSAFSRVRVDFMLCSCHWLTARLQTYWMEASTLRCLSSREPTEDEVIKKILEDM